jgi:hypothetical protein
MAEEVLYAREFSGEAETIMQPSRSGTSNATTIDPTAPRGRPTTCYPAQDQRHQRPALIHLTRTVRASTYTSRCRLQDINPKGILAGSYWEIMMTVQVIENFSGSTLATRSIEPIGIVGRASSSHIPHRHPKSAPIDLPSLADSYNYPIQGQIVADYRSDCRGEEWE